MKTDLSIIFFTDGLAGDELESFALRLDERGYDTLFVPEFFGREPFSTVSYVLAAKSSDPTCGSTSSSPAASRGAGSP